MAVTLTKVQRGVTAYGRRFVEADVAFPNPYTVGGETVGITPAALGLKRVSSIEIVYRATAGFGSGRTGNAAANVNHGRQIVPDVSNPAAPKLKLFVSNTTESGAIDQTQVVQRVRFID